MDVGLRALDVVVQVVPEHVYEVDGVVAGAARRVPREQHERDVADVVVDDGVGVLQLERRLPVAEEDGRRRVRRPQALLQLLHEHLADDDVVLVAEARREDHGDSVGFCLDVPSRQSLC